MDHVASTYAGNADGNWIDDRPEARTFRVNRATMTSEAVLALEWERLFASSWLYVGHESEIPNAGDYRRRTVAKRPLMFVRGSDGQAHVFYNTCTHRGALICRSDTGNRKSFQCFYHAWTFNNDGELVGVPDIEAYGDEFDKSAYSLKVPPKVESYRGFVFVAYSEDVPPLIDHLGEIRSYMDLTLDAGEAMGGWVTARGEVAYQIRANWKLMIENSIDNYHFNAVHQTYNAYMARRKAQLVDADAEADGSGSHRRDRGITTGFTVAGGHGGFTFSKAHSGRPLATWSPHYGHEAKAEIEEIRQELTALYGQERMIQMAEGSRSLFVFPNLMFQDSATGFRLRAMWPVAPGLTDVRQWEFVPKNEGPALRRIRMEAARAFLGPGGFATPDDVEAVESCQQGFGAQEVEWSDISRGVSFESNRDDHELQMRGFWRQWYKRVAATR